MRLVNLPPRLAPTVPTAVKVPAIGLLFWVIKVLTTGMGEAASDWIGSLPVVLIGLVGLVAVGLFATSIWLQFRTPRYVAQVYWFAVAMVAVFGTMAADALHAGLMMPYWASTAAYAVVVALIFRSWYRSEGTLSIHSITTTRREAYYWLTVLATFALGTAAGDLTAAELKLGFFSSGLLFAAAMVVPALAWWRFHLNPVAAFWSTYVLTRPLGASFADWLGKPHRVEGGLGYTDGAVAGVAALLIAGLVAYVAMSGHDAQEDDGSAEPAPRPESASIPA